MAWDNPRPVILRDIQKIDDDDVCRISSEISVKP
jgi:hypothetical protein